MYSKTETQFVNDHEDFRDKIANYLCSGHSRKMRGRDQVMQWLLRGRSPHLDYNNPLARIEVCTSLVAEIDKVVPQDKRYYLLSASPGRFGHDPNNGRFAAKRLEAIKDWIQHELFGLNYVAAIEGAWFGNFTRHPHEAPRVSFHFHAIVWGAPPRRVKAVADRIERSEWPFVSGMGVSDHGKRPSESLGSYVRYILKAPMQEYRLTDGLDGQPSQATVVRGRSRVKKRQLRPGAACRMMRVIGDANIADYMIAGGRGVEAMEAALAQAREQLSHQEAKRQRRIERAVWGN